MLCDLILFYSRELWDQIGNPCYYILYGLRDIVKSSINTPTYDYFPDCCDFHKDEHYVLDTKLELDYLAIKEIYNYCQENNVIASVVPHKWRPPICRYELEEFLKGQEK